MEEATTTQLPLNYTASVDVDYKATGDYDCSAQPDDLMVFSCVCLAIALCGLAGNGRVLWLLGFHVKKKPFTIYVLNLAVADFCLLLLFALILLSFLTLVVFCLFEFLTFFVAFVTALEFLCHFFDLSSLGLLAAISTERCASVLFPVWYRCRRPKHLSGAVCGLLWALSGGFVLSLYLSLASAESPLTELAAVAIGVSIALSAVVLVSNLALLVRLRCCSRRRHPGKLYVAVLLNVVFFFALGVPFGVEVFLNLPSSYDLLPENTVFLLALLNCSINPVVYFLVGGCRRCRFRGSIQVGFRRLFEEDAASEEESREPEAATVETAV